MDDLRRAVHGWRPKPVERSDRIEAAPVRAFAGLLDAPAPATGDGDPLPPLWHWLAFAEHPAQAELGEDGHPARGHFLPPIPDRRRMILGGRLEVRRRLRVGDELTRRTSLVAAEPKHGRSGAMVVVTLRHQLRRAGELVVQEEQDLGYRSQPAGAPRGLAPVPVVAPPEGAPPPPPEAWRLRVDPDPVLLFRFSALTHNAHRIHYDHPYATGVEGYPGVVVHGPLLALLLLELPRRYAPERRVAAFSYRLLRPAFAGDEVVAGGRPDSDALAAGVPGGPPSAVGSVAYA